MANLKSDSQSLLSISKSCTKALYISFELITQLNSKRTKSKVANLKLNSWSQPPVTRPVFELITQEVTNLKSDSWLQQPDSKLAILVHLVHNQHKTIGASS